MIDDLPVPDFGRGMIENLDLRDLGRCIVVTQEAPWNLYGERFRETAPDVVKVEEAGLSSLDSLSQEAAGYDTVVAFGGGLAIDSAKFAAWKNEKRLITIPTAISADVAVCRAIAIRDDWKVRYVGDKMPDRLIVDFDIIQSAPPHINRGGVCDILSCYTALRDWEIAHTDTGEPTDPDTIGRTRHLLERLFAHQQAIRDVTEEGIHFLMEGYIEEVRLCEQYGSPRPEEGSEHFFAYNLEYRMRRPFLHGTIVSLGVVLMTMLQQQDPDEVVGFLDGAGVPWRPEHAGLQDDQIIKTIETLYDYCVDEDFCYTVVNRQKPDRETASRLVDNISKM